MASDAPVKKPSMTSNPSGGGNDPLSRFKITEELGKGYILFGFFFSISLATTNKESQ